MRLSIAIPSLIGISSLFAPPARGQGPAYPSEGLHLMSQVLPDEFTPPQGWGTTCWAYTSPSGREYAVVGTYRGTGFVEVTDPGRPRIVGLVDGLESHYRSVRTYAHYAYAICNAGGGIQVLDLGQIDAGAVTLANTVLTGGNPKTHTLALDTTSGFLYRIGFESGNPGLIFYDLADPAAPELAGVWPPPTHDAEVVTYTSGPFAGRQIAFACTYFPSNGLTLVDVTDKAAPVSLATVSYPNAGLSHQVTLSEDRRFAFLNDEYDEPYGGLPSTTYVFLVADINAPTYLGSFTNGNPAITHDAYVKGNRLFCANYTSGLRVFDVSSPLEAFESAWFDTWPCGDQAVGSGLYSTCPYFDSGIVVGNDIVGGLFVWTLGPPRLTFAYPGGRPANFEPLGASLAVAISELNPGEYLPGSACLEFDLGAGLVSVPLTGEPGDLRAELPPLPCGSNVRYSLAARTTDGFTWRDPQPSATGDGAYTATVASSETVLFRDDFEQPGPWVPSFSVKQTGAWERVVAPTASPYAPGLDHTPLGTACWVTGPDSGNCQVDNEVTGGPYYLTSPRLDLSGQTDPYVRYARWFSNVGGTPRDDALLVEVTSDGVQWVQAEAVGPDLPAGRDTNGGWVVHQFRVRDYVPLSQANRVRFVAADDQEHGGGFPAGWHDHSLVEAALDDFEVLEPTCAAALSYCTAGTSALGCQVLLAASGAASATAPSGFVLSGLGAEGGRAGLFYYGTSGRQASPWGSGTSFQCVVPPLVRLGLLSAEGTPGTCGGLFAQDLNARWCAECPEPGKNPGPGALAQAQLWYRDPLNTSSKTTSLSDALEFLVGP